MKNGLAPLVGSHPRWLLLGSFPSETSLEKQEYYGFRRNQLWPILFACWQEPYAATFTYAEKSAFLKHHQIALWDVYDQCERTGSLDQAIHSAHVNDFHLFLKTYPSIQGILLNGQRAGKEWRRLCQKNPNLAAYPAVVCPSTSPAHAQLSFQAKLVHWQAAFAELETKKKARLDSST